MEQVNKLPQIAAIYQQVETALFGGMTTSNFESTMNAVESQFEAMVDSLEELGFSAEYIAKVEPVELAGAIITYASLANYDLIVKKGINIGDIVQVPIVLTKKISTEYTLED
jgi:hypothetical protein